MLPHPQCSPDLINSAHFLFPNLKKCFTGKRFGSDDEFASQANAYFGELVKSGDYVGQINEPRKWFMVLSRPYEIIKIIFQVHFSSHRS